MKERVYLIKMTLILDTESLILQKLVFHGIITLEALDTDFVERTLNYEHKKSFTISGFCH